MDWRERITIDPNKFDGEPHFRNNKIKVSAVLDRLSNADREEQILACFRSLTSDDIEAAVAYDREN